MRGYFSDVLSYFVCEEHHELNILSISYGYGDGKKFKSKYFDRIKRIYNREATQSNFSRIAISLDVIEEGFDNKTNLHKVKISHSFLNNSNSYYSTLEDLSKKFEKEQIKIRHLEDLKTIYDYIFTELYRLNESMKKLYSLCIDLEVKVYSVSKNMFTYEDSLPIQQIFKINTRANCFSSV